MYVVKGTTVENDYKDVLKSVSVAYAVSKKPVEQVKLLIFALFSLFF